MYSLCVSLHLMLSLWLMISKSAELQSVNSRALNARQERVRTGINLL